MLFYKKNLDIKLELNDDILKTLIDYSLFEKYDKEYFINNKIVPIYENDISIKFAVCKKFKFEYN